MNAINPPVCIFAGRMMLHCPSETAAVKFLHPRLLKGFPVKETHEAGSFQVEDW